MFPIVALLKCPVKVRYDSHDRVFKVLKEHCSVNIDKDGGDIAFVTYEKGEAEAKVILKLAVFSTHSSLDSCVIGPFPRDAFLTQYLQNRRKQMTHCYQLGPFQFRPKLYFKIPANILTPAICLMPELSRLSTQLTKEALEMQNGDALACVRDTFPEHRVFKIQPPGRRCQLQLCLLSLEGTWWCTSSQVQTFGGVSSS